MTKKRELMFSIVRGLLAILIALLVATLLIFISANGESVSEKLSSTGDALKQMLVGPLFRMGKNGTRFETKRLTDILASMIPIIFTGLSVCIMFSANQFNLGAEGGIMLGAFVTGMAAIYLPMAAGLHPIVAILLGGISVGIMMLLPALLKSKLDVSEMVCSLMLNYIVMYLIKFVLNTYLADKSKGQIQSYEFLESAKIAQLVDDGSKLSVGFLIAIAAVILCGLFMYRTRWGYAIRMIGINQAFSSRSCSAASLPVSAAASRCWADTRPSPGALFPATAGQALPLPSLPATIRGLFLPRRSLWRIFPRAAT